MRLVWTLLVLIACAAAARGFVRVGPLAGHDALAYYSTQSEFHENICEGVWIPRWRGWGRFGYGDTKLAHRPPLTHYLAEPFIAFSGRRIAGAHAAMIVIVFLAGWGMWLLGRGLLGPRYGAVAAIAYVSTHYVLANCYLRAAWYEVAAYAAMPWILWANEALPLAGRCVETASGRWRRRPLFVALGALGWAALICGHPQTAMFFAPAAACAVLLRAGAMRSWRGGLWSLVAFAVGLLISAPYWLVFALEMPLGRMQLYDLNYQSYFVNFLDLRSLIFDVWPDQYILFKETKNYLGHPRFWEMHAFNVWALAALAVSPVLWFRVKAPRDRAGRAMSMFLWFWILACVVIALPLSWGLWERLDFLRYVNFPWRSLGVAALCLALLTGLTLRQLLIALGANRAVKNAAALAAVAMIAAGAWPHAMGFAAFEPTEDKLTPAGMIEDLGVPQQYHTPKWAMDYPTEPAAVAVELIEGKGSGAMQRRGETRWDFTIQAETPVTIQINHHYYPGWRLYDGGVDPVDAQPSPVGLMEFPLEAGGHDLSLRFESTPARRFADGLGLAGLLAALITLAVARFPACRRRIPAGSKAA